MYTCCLRICCFFIFKATVIHHQYFRWTNLWSYHAHMCASRWTNSRNISRSKCKARNVPYIWHLLVQLRMSRMGRMGSRVGKHNVKLLSSLCVPKVSQRPSKEAMTNRWEVAYRILCSRLRCWLNSAPKPSYLAHLWIAAHLVPGFPSQPGLVPGGFFWWG